LKGFGEVDDLYGGEGEDVLYGHADSDYMLGGSGDDKLFGGPGMFPDGFVSDDQLRGGPGNDQLDGGSGDDTYELYGGFGHDRVTDASGDDYLAFESEDGLVIDLTPGANPNVSKKTRAGTVDWDSSVVIEDASGSFGNDKMVGNDAPNWPLGWDGDNDIAGGGGADTIWSDGGGTISGGEGNDDIGRGRGESDIHGGPATMRSQAGWAPTSSIAGKAQTSRASSPKPPNPSTARRSAGISLEPTFGPIVVIGWVVRRSSDGPQDVVDPRRRVNGSFLRDRTVPDVARELPRLAERDRSLVLYGAVLGGEDRAEHDVGAIPHRHVATERGVGRHVGRVVDVGSATAAFQDHASTPLAQYRRPRCTQGISRVHPSAWKVGVSELHVQGVPSSSARRSSCDDRGKPVSSNHGPV
jgi:hypothetical protein